MEPYSVYLGASDDVTTFPARCDISNRHASSVCVSVFAIAFLLRALADKILI